MDGRDALSDQTPPKPQNRDEPIGSRLQYPQNDQHLRSEKADQSDPSLRGNFAQI